MAQGPEWTWPEGDAEVAGTQLAQNEFWTKMRRFAGRIPFAEDLAAAYFCARDPDTPAKVKGVLLGALAYFVMPVDMVPDFIAGFGFTDDATVLATALSLVGSYIKPRHRKRAAEAFDKPFAGEVEIVVNP